MCVIILTTTRFPEDFLEVLLGHPHNTFLEFFFSREKNLDS